MASTTEVQLKQRSVTEFLYMEKTVEITQSWHWVGAMNAHRRKEKPPYVSLSGPTEPI